MAKPTKTREEARWLELAQSGDDEAFGRLVEAFQGPVYNLCLRMLGEQDEAEDAAQETFWKAYRNLGRYDPQRKFINWLLAIASNHCVDRLRKRGLKLVSLQAMPWLETAVEQELGPEGAMAQAEEDHKVRQLLAELGGVDRAAIVLRYWYDLSYSEIGDALSLTESAVKSRLHRARTSLAEGWLAAQPTTSGLERKAG
ncbi:MAG: sigma-70 family RNA polymerase sigma factor [Anaerolineales bacterium]